MCGKCRFGELEEHALENRGDDNTSVRVYHTDLHHTDLRAPSMSKRACSGKASFMVTAPVRWKTLSAMSGFSLRATKTLRLTQYTGVPKRFSSKVAPDIWRHQ